MTHQDVDRSDADVASEDATEPAVISFELSFDCDNDAFAGHPDNLMLEIKAVLKRAVRVLDSGRESGACVDTNGNVIGYFNIDHGED